MRSVENTKCEKYRVQKMWSVGEMRSVENVEIHMDSGGSGSHFLVNIFKPPASMLAGCLKIFAKKCEPERPTVHVCMINLEPELFCYLNNCDVNIDGIGEFFERRS